MSGAVWERDGRGWQVRRDASTLTVARRIPVRWDVAVVSRMPDLGRRRLAHAVRQDLWRALRRVRGFAPVVEVTREAGGLRLRAGGRVDGAMPDGLPARIESLLADPVRRSAWTRSAAHRVRG